ncbi:efflux RND transporter periplasmic adaptor subunit [Stappia sp. ICDLI1TA098]
MRLWALAGLSVLGLAALLYVQPWVERPRSVAVEIATLAPVTRVLAVNGRVAAVHSVDVRPLVSGTLETLSVAEGDEVAAGQVLGLIDAKTQSAVLRQAMAGRDAALEAQQQASEAYDRSVSLGRTIARSVLETRAHAVELAVQEVARLTALADQARIALQNHTVRAPIPGSVLILNVDEGQFVDTSTLLLILADLRELEVETDVDEAYARQISRNQTAILQLAGETGTRTGHVNFVSTRVDVATGGLAVRISFDDPVIAPVGMTVTTNILVDQQAAALTVPRTSMVAGPTGTAVFVVEDRKARLRPITVVDWPATRLIATAGLAEGDVVIVDAAGLADGQAVEAVQP